MFSLWERKIYECKLGKLCRLLEFKRAVGLSYSLPSFVLFCFFTMNQFCIISESKNFYLDDEDSYLFLAGNTTHTSAHWLFSVTRHSQQMSSWMFQGLDLPLSHRNLICCWQPMLVALVPNGSSVLCKRLLDVQLAGAMLLLLQHLVLLGTLLRH